MELDAEKMTANGWKKEGAYWVHKLKTTTSLPKDLTDFSKGFKKERLQYHIEKTGKNKWEMLLLTDRKNKIKNDDIILGMMNLTKKNIENAYKANEPKVPEYYKGITL